MSHIKSKLQILKSKTILIFEVPKHVAILVVSVMIFPEVHNMIAELKTQA